jgi:hypothetical protein
MAIEEEREFQLEKLKVQLKHQVLWSSVTLLIAVEFAVFTSVATTFLSYGLTSGNPYYVFVAVASIVCLYIVARGTIHYFQSKKIEDIMDKNIEKEIQSIRNRFVVSKTEQSENKKKEKTETTPHMQDEQENLRLEYQVLNDTVNRRYRDMLLVESIMIPSTLTIVAFSIIYRTNFGMNFLGLPNSLFIPLISAILLGFLLFLRWTTNGLNDLNFERLREIEDELQIKGHSYIQQQWHLKIRFKIRKYLWYFIFVLLIGVYAFTTWWLFR